MALSRLRLSGLRIVALLEAAKAALVLLAGIGLFGLIHRDLHELAANLIRHLHLNPSRQFARIFLDAAERVSDSHLWLLASLAFSYVIVRSIQAYGLWRERRWAEWFSIIAGSIYLPVEVYELYHGVSWFKVLALTINLCIVAYIAYVMRSASH